MLTTHAISPRTPCTGPYIFFIIAVLLTHVRRASVEVIHIVTVMMANFCKQFGPRSGPTKRWA